MKTIVTHFNPDLDALCGIWLIKRFFSGWQKAEVKFVPANKTLDNLPVDSDPEVIHVDTGLGKFDHHQEGVKLVACSLVFEELKRKGEKLKDEEALERLVAVVQDADVGNYISWPESQTDRYEFSLDGLIGGFKREGLPGEKIVDLGLKSLDAVYTSLKQKIKAEEILKTGKVFKTKWGEGVAFETENDMVLDLGEKKGYAVVMRKDPRGGNVRIYARNDRGVDLTPVFEKLKEKDPEASWFLHPSKCILLNGSTKNPEMQSTKLNLEEAIEILKATSH